MTQTKKLQDSGKQPGMADDFCLQTCKTSVFQNHVFETKPLPTFPLLLAEHAYVVWTSSGSSNLPSIFRLRALRYWKSVDLKYSSYFLNIWVSQTVIISQCIISVTFVNIVKRISKVSLITLLSCVFMQHSFHGERKKIKKVVSLWVWFHFNSNNFLVPISVRSIYKSGL